MKNLYSICLALLVVINVNSLAQKGIDPNYKEKQERNHEINAHYDKAPVQELYEKNVLRPSKDPNDQWDIVLTFNTSDPYQPGIETDGNHFYTPTWNSNNFTRYNMDGSEPETFSIPGVTSIRDMAFDGQYFYGSDASMTLHVMDLANEIEVNTIACSCTGITGIRHIAYDPGLDNWNGGFWIGNWDELGAIDMNGNELVAYLPGVALSAYGSAYDNWTDPSNPKLWIAMQGANGDENTFHEFDINTQSLTGVTHSAGDVPGIGNLMAGGACSYVDVTSGKFVLVGNNQQDPNLVFGYELTPTVEPSAPGKATSLSAIPGSFGALEIQVEWNNPTVTADGSTLTDLDSVVLYVDDVSKYANNTPTIGGIESHLITIPDGGMRTVKVVGYNDAGEGVPADTSVWVGPDAPPAVIDLTLSSLGNDTALLNWTNPSSTFNGHHGGYFDGSITGYNIIRHPGNQGFNINGAVNYWKDHTINSPELYSYTVIPTNNYGSGTASTSNQTVIGMNTALIPLNEDFETTNDYFFLNENTQSTALITNGIGVGDSHALILTGKSSGNWPIGTTTANEAWGYTEHHASAVANIDASAIDPNEMLVLTLSIKQDYSYQQTYSWFRLMVNNEPIPNINGDTSIHPVSHYHQFQTLTYDLSDYAGSTFSLNLQTSCKYYNDLAIIDNVRILQAAPYDLTAEKLLGEINPVANMPTDFQVLICNYGSDPASNYLLELFRENVDTAIADTNITGHTIQPFSYDTLNITWTPSIADTVKLRASVTLQGDTNHVNDTSAYKQVVVNQEGMSVISIGDFSSIQQTSPRIPFDYYWKNSLSETIYFKDELDTGGIISRIKYKYAIVQSDCPTDTLRIWMGETSKDSLTDGYIPSTQLKQVLYQEILPPNPGIQELDLILDEPFIYSGDKNLVILNNKMFSTVYCIFEIDFYTTSTPAHPVRTLANNSDAYYLNPSNPPEPESCTGEHPDIHIFLYNRNLGTLKGTINDSINPIAEAELTLIADSSNIKCSAMSDANGNYKFPYLPKDTYSLTIEKFPYTKKTITGIQINENDTTILPITLTPIPAYSVSGYVEGIDNPGTGIEGATVSLYGVDTFEVVTGANGSFSLNNVWNGYRYNVKITADDYLTYHDTIDVDSSNIDLGVITLEELMAPPYELSVDQEMVLGSAKLHWKWDEEYNKPTSPAPNNTKEFESFNVYLNDLTTPVANTTDTFYAFEGLTPGDDYIAGVSSVYTSGETNINTIGFTAREGLSGNDFISYSVPYQIAETEIDTTQHEISIFLPLNGFDSSHVVPNFEISDSASIHINGVPQVSGETPVDFSGDGMVTYTITSENGINQDWTVNLFALAYINSTNTTNISIYPNPSKNYITIIMGNKFKQADQLSIKVFNVDGKPVYEEKFHQMDQKSLKLHFDKLPAGMYYLHIRGNNSNYYKKLIIQ